MMNLGKILMLAFCAVLSVGAAEQDKGLLNSAFLELDKDDKVNLVRSMNKTFTKEKDEDETAEAKAKRIKTVYALNRDAVRAAKDADKKLVIAEVFATAPMEALPAITDGFAKEVFTRKMLNLDEKDDSFVEFASATLLRVNCRLRQISTARFPGARSAFAVISFLKASGGKPEDLRDQLMFYVLTGSEVLARTKWVPAAMGDDGKPPSYQPIFEAGFVGEEPPHQNLHPMKSPELGNLLVGSELRVKNARDVSGPKPIETERGVIPRGAIENPDSPWYRRRRGDDPDDEPGNYLGHSL